jgi:hypothetical protein
MDIRPQRRAYCIRTTRLDCERRTRVRALACAYVLLVGCVGSNSLAHWPTANRDGFGVPGDVSEEFPTLSRVCHLSVRRTRLLATTWNSGTGVMLRTGLLATAAHNIADYPGSRVEEVQIECGRVRVRSAGSMTAQGVRSAGGAVLDGLFVPRNRHVPSTFGPWPYDYDDDIALLRVPESLGAFDPIPIWREGDPAPTTAVVVGFPGPASDDGYHYLRQAFGAIGDTTPTLVGYRADTERGMSGAPVFECRVDGNVCLPYEGARLVAIHVKEAGGHRFDGLFDRLVQDTLMIFPPLQTAPEQPATAEPSETVIEASRQEAAEPTSGGEETPEPDRELVE